VRARMADLRSKCKPNPRTGSCRTPGGPCAQQSLPVFGEWRRARDPSNVSHPPRPSGTARPWRARLAARVGTRWSVVPPHHCPLTGGDQRGAETQSTTDRPRRERERDTQARSGEAKHACANEESWRPPSKARHLSFAQSRGQQQLRASLCGTKWVGPRMTWAGEESLPSTSSHRRRLPSLLPPTPHPSVPRHHHHLLTRVLPPLAWRAWHLLASRFSLASIYRSVEAPAWASHLHSLVSFGPLPLAWLPSGGDTATSRGGPFLSLLLLCLTLPGLVPSALPLLECSRALFLCSFS
jgi:hypothetical protein